MEDLIVKTVTRLIVPFIQLYGVFIILHGHISPGGGFAGGAIIASSLVLYTLTYGLNNGHKKMPHNISSKIESGGLLCFIMLGLVGIISGGNFLANKSAGFNMGEFGRIFSAGLIPLATIAIGLKVASTIVTLFHTMIEEE